MTAPAKHIAFEQQQLRRTLKTDYSLVDLFQGDQQEYVRLPTGRRTSVADSPRELLTDVETVTFNTSSAAWMTHGLETRILKCVIFLRGGTISTQDFTFPAEETAEKVICDAVPSLAISDKGELARRLLELERDLRDEANPTCPGISVESLKKFFSFVRSNPDIRMPAISVSPDCNVYTSWKADSSRVFSIHFIPEADVRFVLFRPSQKQRGKMIRLSGSAVLEEVIDIARREGATDWIRRERTASSR